MAKGMRIIALEPVAIRGDHESILKVQRGRGESLSTQAVLPDGRMVRAEGALAQDALAIAVNYFVKQTARDTEKAALQHRRNSQP